MSAEPLTPTVAFAVGDKVTVTSHYLWCGRDTCGLQGEVVEVWDDREGDPALYEIAIEGWGTIPYFGSELVAS